MDSYETRPGDEHVEPLFAGLGIGESEERAPQSAVGRPTGPRWAAVVAVGGAVLFWWLG